MQIVINDYYRKKLEHIKRKIGIPIKNQVENALKEYLNSDHIAGYLEDLDD